MKQPEPKQCQQCGKTFIPSKNDKRIVFCSSECRLQNRKDNGYMDKYYHANLKKWQDAYNSREHRDAKNEARRIKYAEDEEYREHQKELVKSYHKKHPEAKQRQRLKKYNITLDEKNNLMKKQNGKCAICGNDGTNSKWGKLYVDHDHVTGKVRGLLCGKCNFALGQLNDDITLLEKAITYLRRQNE